MRRAAGFLGEAVVYAGVTVVAYVLLLGRDHSYTHDPVTGAQHGPYSTWQVAALVLVLLAVGLVGASGRNRWALVVVPVALTYCWCVTAFGQPDGDGLAGVGAMLVFVGSATSTAAMILIGPGLRILRRRDTRDLWLRSLWRRAEARGPARGVGLPTLFTAAVGFCLGSSVIGHEVLGAAVGLLAGAAGYLALLALARSVDRRGVPAG